MDFGIAKVMGGRSLTHTGHPDGHRNMAPEQVMNRGVDIRSDIYALGVTLYEMLRPGPLRKRQRLPGDERSREHAASAADAVLPVHGEGRAAGTSVGANYREANRARSKAEFISKIGDCLKEADETLYWLELLLEEKIVPPAKLQPLVWKPANWWPFSSPS